MKKWIIFAILLIPALVIAGSTTTNLGLYKPSVGEQDWGASVNSNFDTVDSALGAKFITQTSDGTLPNEQALGDLSTGMMKVTTSTGVVSSVTTLSGLNTAISASIADGAHTTDTGPSPDCSGTTTYQDGEGNCDDLSLVYLSNVVEDTTPQLGGELDAQGNNIIDLGDVTFKTGANGGTLRTGTAAADKYRLQGYDTNAAAYRNVFQVDSGNPVTFAFNEDGVDMDFRAEGVGQANALFIQGSDGNVGIHTGTPNSTLDVGGTITATGWSGIGATDLSDVNTATATAGRIFVADGTDFESMQLQGDCTLNGAGFITCDGGGVAELADLTDVDSTVGSPSDGDIMVYRDSGSDWILESKPAAGSNPAFGDITTGTNTSATMTVGTGASIAVSGSGTVTATGLSGVSATALSDVNSATQTAGNLFISDGTDFESMTLQGDCTLNGAGFITCDGAGVSELTDLNDVATATQTAGNILVSDGTDFRSRTISNAITIDGDGVAILQDDTVGTSNLADEDWGDMTVSSGVVTLDTGVVSTNELADINSVTKTAGRLFIADGTDFESMELQGDCSMNGAGFITCSGGGATTEAELESDLTDVTNVFTNNDGALADDDLSDDSVAALSDINTATASLGRLLVGSGSSFDSVDLLYVDHQASQVGIGTTAPDGVLDVDGVDGIIPPKQTADPCTAANEGMIFYNDTSNYMCYCDGTNDLKMNDNTTACF